MDPHSLDVLEYGKVKAMLAGYAASSLGKAAAAALEPLADAAAVRIAVEETTELRALLERRGRIPVAGMTDVRPAVRGADAAEKALEPPALLDIRGCLLAARHLRQLTLAVREQREPLLPHSRRSFDAPPSPRSASSSPEPSTATTWSTSSPSEQPAESDPSTAPGSASRSSSGTASSRSASTT